MVSSADEASTMLTVNGDLTLGANSELKLDVNAFDDRAPVVVSAAGANVRIDGVLQIINTGNELSMGESATLIDLPSDGRLTGFFDGLREGASIQMGDNTYFISYRGGPDGNDVVLAAASAMVHDGVLEVLGMDINDHIVVRPTTGDRIEVYHRAGRMTM